jgi:putative transposase
MSASWQADRTGRTKGYGAPTCPAGNQPRTRPYAVLVARAGYLPVPLASEDYMELLPACWRTVTDNRIVIGNPPAVRGRFAPERPQLRAVEGAITAPWTKLPVVAVPLADFTWWYARQALAARGKDDTSRESFIFFSFPEIVPTAGLDHAPDSIGDS